MFIVQTKNFLLISITVATIAKTYWKQNVRPEQGDLTIPIAKLGKQSRKN